MTDTFNVGDTVYGIKNLYIDNFDDDYYAIPIPVSVFKSTITECEEWRDDVMRVKLADGNFYLSSKKSLH